MTLEEFERRLRAQAQYQGSQAQKDDIEQNKRVINQSGNTSTVIRDLRDPIIINKEKQENQNSFNNQLITKNNDVKNTLKAPISSTIRKATGISADNVVKKEDNSNNIFSDLGNVAKNSWIGVKLGGLNFINGLSKIGNMVSDKIFNREERTIKAIDEDLKNLGIDGSGLSLEEKIKKLIDVDPLSMDKYNRLLTVNSMTSTGDDLGSKIINAMAVLRGNNNNFLLAPYQDLMNGVTLTEDENGNYVPDSWISDRQINETDKRIIELEEEANKNTEDINNPALKYASNLMPSLGSNATSLVINTVAPGIGSLFFTGSAVNSYALDGKEKGLSDEASLLYGSVLGVVDGQLEKIGLNNLTKAGKEMVKGSTKKALKSYATSMVDNYIQEALMEPVQETTNQVFTGESDWSNMPSRMNQAGVAGAVSSAILGGVSAGVSKGVNIATNTNQQNKLKTQITEKINNNTMLEKDVKTQMLNSLDKLNVNSLTNLNHELDTIDEVITQINKSDITNVIESRKNSLNSNQNSKVSLFSQYKNSKLDNNVINSAMEIVPSNKQNKRTKEQWLKVAEQIGNNINLEDAEMYAYKTWMDMRPNNKNNLNRQGKSYVPFTVDEWVNKVKEASSNNVTNNQEQIKSVNELLSKNIENALFDDEFYKRFEYEDRSKINDTIENLESKREELLKNTKNNEFNDEIFDINAKINALKNGYDNLYDYYVGRAKNEIIEEYNRNPAKYEKIINQKQQQLDNEQKLNAEIQESTPQKRQQYEIIKQTNPMLDDYHTGIRSPKDIKTFNEVINDDESFTWGDFSKEDAQQALKQGKITVYSSYPIEQGVFVSTSKIQAQEYAGGNGSKVYSKEVPLEDVAWINGDEGQYAKLANDNKTFEEIQFKNEIDIKQRKVYNKITTKNISNAEKAQVSSEVNQFRKDDGTHFIDLSKNGYKSYIYHKDGNNVEVLARVSGNEDFINYVRRGIENGTYNYTKGPSEWATEFKTKYRNYSISNDSLSRERTSSRNDNVVNRTNRQENNTNRRNDIKQNSGNESRELAPTSSLLEKLENKKSNIIDEKVSEYIKSVKDNFNTDINIDTNVVNKDNIVPIDYGNEKQTTIYKRARDIFQKIGKRVFINKNDGEKIYVTNTDINESISKTIKNPKQNKLLKENMAVFSKLDKIIENGKEISNSKIDSKGRENFSDYRYYVTNAIINGKKYVVEFDTRVQERNNGTEERHFRLERIYEIKEGDSATGADIKSTSQVGTESPSINNIIPSEQNYVNNAEKSQKIAPVKKVMNNVNENNIQDISKLPTSKERVKSIFENNVNNALNNKYSKRSTILGKVKSNIAIKIKDILGIDVSNRTHKLSDYDIRHMMNQHSDAIKESKKGQIPITSDDIKKIPDIIENPSDIVKGTDNKLGETIRYIKNYNDNTTFVVEVVPENSNDLIIKTMWKKPSTLTNTVNSPSSTSETKGSDISSTNNIIPPTQNYVNNTENNQKIAPVKKVMNPAEIAKLTLEDANITPNLKNKDYIKGNKQSSFYKNITQTSKFLNEDYREAMSKDENIKYYKGISNKEQLKNAYDRLNKDGQSETNKWFAKETKEMTADDVAEGWILLKLYQDKGDIKSAIQVAKKMRDAGTKAGQQIQAYNILQRLTPEGMFYYVQSELDEAYNKMVKGKSKAWIEENRSKFELTPQETEFIKENMNDLQNITDEYERKVKLAEIQKLFTDKIPPARGQGIKSWMRISMLFNPKTQVRNIAGNAVIIPVNMFSDSVSAGIDKLIAKKTGVRTTGMTNLKSYSKGFIKGLYESYNDFIKDINTRNIQGDRFEIGKGGKSFKNEGIGKTLNRVDSLLSFILDAGDRGFYEASFINSINNQLVLNNTTEVTQDMVDIATTEALQRTWQDNNEYTKTVLGIRNKLNKLNIAGYGVGDVLIPFAKTPANLTKAIIDYSPVGVISTIKSGVKLKNAIETGQFTPQMQHDFVQKLGKATAGTMLYILGYALASAGIATGESDEDKDVANFMKNTLGTNSYSIKIGDKTFTYDWAQPVATPFAIMTNFVKYNKENPDASIIDKAINSLNIGTNQLLEQSFMESINTVLNGNGNIIENLSEAVLDLPSRAIPTFLKQIADMIDPVQRTTYDKTSPTNTAINKVKAKIPFVSKTLAPTVDTLGREVKKYGGNNGIFNVFINPANVNSSFVSRSAREIYNLYKATGDKTIMPRVAGYSLTYNNENYNLTPEERARYQKTMGKYVNSTVEKLLNNSNYEKLTDIEKTEIVNQIVSDGNEYAKEEYAKNNNIEYERKNMNVKVDNKIKEGLDTTNAYIFKTKINDIEGEKGVTNSELNNKLKYIMNMDTDNKQKQFMVELSSNDTDYNVSVNDLNKLKGNYLTYLQQSGKIPENGGMTAREKYIKLVDANIPVEQLNKYYNEIGDVEGVKDENGKTVSGSKKQAVFDYINSLSLNIPQKQILLAREYDSFAKEYAVDILNYINSLSLTKNEKISIFNSIYQ